MNFNDSLKQISAVLLMDVREAKIFTGSKNCRGIKVQNKGSVLVCTFFDCVIMKSRKSNYTNSGE